MLCLKHLGVMRHSGPTGEGKGEVGVESGEFQRAALGSESYRIVGLLCLLAALLVGLVARNLAIGQFWLLYWQILVLALAIVGETITLAVVKRALRTGRDVPRGIWPISVLIEAG